MPKIEQELIDPAIEPGTEKAHRAVRAAISSVPVLGGAILEAFNAIILPPMELRKAAWMQQVTEAITNYMKKVYRWCCRYDDAKWYTYKKDN